MLNIGEHKIVYLYKMKNSILTSVMIVIRRGVMAYDQRLSYKLVLYRYEDNNNVYVVF
jgi:hypothetical protein